MIKKTFNMGAREFLGISQKKVDFLVGQSAVSCENSSYLMTSHFLNVHSLVFSLRAKAITPGAELI